MDILSYQDLKDIQLPKWPGCDVDGQAVSPKQAMEILVRTSNGNFMTNDREFEKSVNDIFYSAIPTAWPHRWWEFLYPMLYGVSRSDQQMVDVYKWASAYKSQMGVLNLRYLDTQRVCSSYIGGPNGWCDWNGSIFQRNKNIGKWPDAQEVFDDWSMIATAFPFLKLTCRLLAHEAGYHKDNCFDKPTVAVAYEVENGSVIARMPNSQDHELASTAIDNETFFQSFTPFNIITERGCTLSIWKEACELTVKQQGLMVTA